MFRYFSIVWPTESESAESAAGLVRQRLLGANSDWRAVLKTSGAEVYCAGATRGSGDAVPLNDQLGVVVGTTFAANSDTRNIRFDAAAARRVIESRGSSLVATHWGSYVLFMKAPHEAEVLIFRGPMTILPCFWTTFGAVTLIFSRVEDCSALSVCKFSVNWECIRAQAVGGDYLGHQTALNELRQLVCGEALLIRNEERNSQAYWAPSTISREPQAPDMTNAASLLRQATRTTVNAWMSMHRTCLIKLSGGFDSSVVLACAARAPSRPEVVCVNFWSDGPGDERSYARSMARASNVELLEYKHDTNVDLRRFLTCALTGNPPVHFTAFDDEPRLIAVAKERCATGIFSGEIGDDVFGHAPFAGCLLETFQSERASLKFLRAAVNYASLNRISVWKAISQVFQYRQFLRATSHWSFYRFRKLSCLTNSLVSRDVTDEYEASLASRYIHPWFRDEHNLPAGSVMLVWSLITATSTWFHSPFGGDQGDLFITPLASQPLVEAFWKIPSHLHFAGGESAAVARSAFGSMLPEDILCRGTSKGTPALWMQEVISHNREFLRTLFFDGVLAAHRVLDLQRMEEALSGEVTSSQIRSTDFLILLYMECWLRGWTKVVRKAVA